MSELESQLAASDAMYEELQTESIGKEEEIGVMGTPLPLVHQKINLIKLIIFFGVSTF